MSSSFKEHSITEFFKKNRQMLGFSGKIRSLTTIVHEYVTNSLDACEEHSILPEIEVSIGEVGKDRYKVKVKDNGPGLPPELLGKAFGKMLAGTKFHRYMQQRGQQGIGAAGCTMYALLTTGHGVQVVSHHKGTSYHAEISTDFNTNEPEINIIKTQPSEDHGIEVYGEFGDVKYDRGKYGVAEYLKRTAISNPHVTITLTEPDGNTLLFPRSVESIPKKPQEVLPHPLGITTHDLYEMAKNEQEYKQLTTFLQHRFARITLKRVKEVGELSGVDLTLAPTDITWEMAESIAKAFKKIKWIAPSTDSVVPIGKEQIAKSITYLLDPKFYHVVQRSPKVFWGGVPFVVEAAIAFGVSQPSAIMRYANRVPLLFDAAGCAITETVKNIDWKRYGLKSFDDDHVVVFVNISSVYVPYTGAGKQAVSPETEICNEIRNALNECGRALKRHIAGEVRDRERASKVRAIKRYVEQLAADLSSLSGEKRDDISQALHTMIEQKYLLSGGANEQGNN